MIQGTVDRAGGRADISVPAGCPLCGGPLDVRVTSSSAFSCCRPCRWISRSVVNVGPGSVEVGHPPAGYA